MHDPACNRDPASTGGFTVEIVFKKCKRKRAEDPLPQLPDVRRVTSIEMLGVTMTNHLSVGEHVRDVVGKCAQSLHALKLLRHHGMSDDSLTSFFAKENGWWGRPLLPEILGQPARVGAKSPILNR